MASTRDIRRRIKSVKNTRQITKAMELVAASKMKKAQQAALAGRAYAKLMAGMLARLRSAVAWKIAAPVPDPSRTVKTRGILLVTSDKGLCRSAQRESLQARHRSQNAGEVLRDRTQGRAVPRAHEARPRRRFPNVGIRSCRRSRR